MPLDQLEEHGRPVLRRLGENLQTRGPEHCGEVIAALPAAGYTLAFA